MFQGFLRGSGNVLGVWDGFGRILEEFQDGSVVIESTAISMFACPDITRSFDSSSFSNPFTTDKTTIKSATANMIPSIDIQEIRDIKLLPFFPNAYLLATQDNSLFFILFIPQSDSWLYFSSNTCGIISG